MVPNPAGIVDENGIRITDPAQPIVLFRGPVTDDPVLVARFKQYLPPRTRTIPFEDDDSCSKERDFAPHDASEIP